jgi:hypothetical protein
MQHVMLRGGGPQTIYYFAKQPRPDGTPAALPPDRTVAENPRNGFLTLKKKSGRVSWPDEGAASDLGAAPTLDSLALEFAGGTLELGLVVEERELVRAPDGTISKRSRGSSRASRGSNAASVT